MRRTAHMTRILEGLDLEMLQTALLGLVQGLTEFLPVSSSGHLVIFKELFHYDAGDTGMLLDVLLHLGTLIAVCIVYYQDIWELILEFCRTVRDIFTGKFHFKGMAPYRRFLFMILLSLVPLFVVLPLQDGIEQLFSNVLFVGCALLVTGCFLLVSDRLKPGRKTMGTTSPRDALTVGVVQAIATMPGISRSGSTITAGLFCGFTREYAVKFSFIMSLPAILGANILQLKKAVDAGISNVPVLPYCIGMLVAAVSGVAAIKLINLVVKSKKFKYFAFYCLAVGAAVIIAKLAIGL